VRDGVKLAYYEAGSGERSFVFVHGWTCDHSYFAPQAEYVVRAGFRSVSVDLRGHGDSDKPEGDYPIERFADDVAFIIAELGLDRPVAVGHSMGGLTVLQLAAAHPQAVRGIVMVDPAPLHFPDPMRQAMEGVFAALEAGNSKPHQDFVANALFLPQDGADLRERVIKDMTSAPRHITLGAGRGMLAFDGRAAAGKCSVPALHIAGDPPLNRQADMAAALPGVVNAQTAGAGHFNHLVVPNQVNDMIDYFTKTRIAW
ncbi:MAG: alpha/beta hydrolase, partial [Myxococcales bacterium]|nr:alpha/beta hydrolase [Myxococcales bacterium]